MLGSGGAPGGRGGPPGADVELPPGGGAAAADESQGAAQAPRRVAGARLSPTRGPQTPPRSPAGAAGDMQDIEDIPPLALGAAAQPSPLPEAVARHIGVAHDGSPYVQRESEVCDACGADGCLDTCSVPRCAPCDARRGERARLEAADGAGSRRRRDITWCEVERHNTLGSCWLVARGEVFDVTEFLAEHPAGVKAILRHGGQECSQDFDFHSKKARTLWRQYRIGTVRDCGAPPSRDTCCVS